LQLFEPCTHNLVFRNQNYCTYFITEFAPNLVEDEDEDEEDDETSQWNDDDFLPNSPEAVQLPGNMYFTVGHYLIQVSHLVRPSDDSFVTRNSGGVQLPGKTYFTMCH